MPNALIVGPSGSAEASESSYLESLSDLLVGFLFIFIILLMAFALALAQAKQRTDQIQQQLTNAGELRTQMLEQIQRALKQQGITIEIDRRFGIARLPESLLFDSNSAEFKPQARRSVRIVAHELATVLPCYAAGVPKGACPSNARVILDAMFVEGHTDSTGSSDLNYDLSFHRAKNAFFAIRADAPSLQLLQNVSKQTLMSLSAYGRDRAIAENTEEKGRAKNRRIDLRFVVGTPRETDLPRPGSGVPLPQ